MHSAMAVALPFVAEEPIGSEMAADAYASGTRIHAPVVVTTLIDNV